MNKIKIENIMFWILIVAAIAIIIWKLFGSPSDIATLISLISLLIGSEIMLWKNHFTIEKNTTLGFMKVSHDFVDLRKDLNIQLNEIKILIKNKS